MKELKTQICIIGGGIAGLWAFAELRAAGYQVILVEQNSLGGTQSLASQGMIHGGQRYSLQGVFSKHTATISEMPEAWDQALAGNAAIDIRNTTVLSETQYLWSPGDLFSNVTAFFASKAMNTKVNALKEADYPEIFKGQKFSGKVYQLPEKVIDLKSLSQCLIAGGEKSLLKAEIQEICSTAEQIDKIVFDQFSITADFYIFAAGSGNELLLKQLRPNKELSQLRPLKQIMVKELDLPFYGHCITSDPRPRMTVSSHPLDNGKYVWYLGGLVAVQGINQTDAEAIDFAKKELRSLFPWISWDNKEWSCLYINRAEPKATNGLLPEGPAITEFENSLACWPTKLTFAPALAKNILKILVEKIPISTSTHRCASGCSLSNTSELNVELAQIGNYPWENAVWTK